MMLRPFAFVFVLTSFVLLAAPSALRADDAPAGAADRDAAAAIAAFDAVPADSSSSEREQLLVELAKVRHPKVTERIVRLSEDEKADSSLRVASLDLLRERCRTEKLDVARVARWLTKESEAAAKALAKGDIGVPIDARSGEVRKGTRETEQAIRRGRERAQVTAATIRLAVALSWKPREPAETFAPFLQSPFDELATVALSTLGGWKEKEALPDLHLLFRMYPRENRWESGAVADAAGSNSSAKASWMSRFGHPLKQRARPEIVRALQAALLSICGRKIDSPEALGLYLKDAGPNASSKR